MDPKVAKMLDALYAKVEELETYLEGTEDTCVRRVQHIHSKNWIFSAGDIGFEWTQEKKKAKTFDIPLAELKKMIWDQGYVLGEDLRIVRSKK